MQFLRSRTLMLVLFTTLAHGLRQSTEQKDALTACGMPTNYWPTSHCFNDFNHVDCCTMDPERTHATNEASKVVGMHKVNFLGSHITEASLHDRGPGGSWCTCHISSPEGKTRYATAFS